MLDADKNFSELYKQIEGKDIEALSFKKGFSEKELLDSLDVISDETKVTGEDLKRLLKSKGVKNITLKIKESGDQSSIEIFEGAISAIKNVMGEVRMGKIPDSKEIKGIVSRMTDSVLKDPNAMLGLTMIKDYDDYLYTHCVNVRTYFSISIGTALGLDEEQSSQRRARRYAPRHRQDRGQRRYHQETRRSGHRRVEPIKGASGNGY